MPEHEQTLIGNPTWVDRRVAPLVLALARREGFTTVSSCQRDPTGNAYVTLYASDGDERLHAAIAPVLQALTAVGIEFQFGEVGARVWTLSIDAEAIEHATEAIQ